MAAHAEYQKLFKLCLPRMLAQAVMLLTCIC